VNSSKKNFKKIIVIKLRDLNTSSSNYKLFSYYVIKSRTEIMGFKVGKKYFF